MRKIIHIKGMSCMHCQMRVTKTLQGIEGIDSVNVSLSENQAIVSATATVSDKLIKSSIKEAGYTVTNIEDAE